MAARRTNPRSTRWVPPRRADNRYWYCWDGSCAVRHHRSPIRPIHGALLTGSKLFPPVCHLLQVALFICLFISFSFLRRQVLCQCANSAQPAGALVRAAAAAAALDGPRDRKAQPHAKTNEPGTACFFHPSPPIILPAAGLRMLLLRLINQSPLL